MAFDVNVKLIALNGKVMQIKRKFYVPEVVDENSKINISRIIYFG